MQPVLQYSSYGRAAERTIDTLINCFLREHAEPLGLQSWPTVVLPRALRHVPVLRIALPRQQEALLVGARKRVNYELLTEPYLESVGRVLDWRRVAGLLLEELSLHYGVPANAELLGQVANSFEHLQQFYAEPPSSAGSPYLRSEQSLVSGHRHHPAPKAREGMSEQDLLRYSPELGAEFQLAYFRAHPDVFRHVGPARIPDLQRTVSGFSAERLIPLHPWQYGWLLRQEPVQNAILEGWLEPLGQGGARFAATSSVRTMLSRFFPYFLKTSLHLRLTNCVRKNASYELDSAVLLSELLSQLTHPFGDSFAVLGEPAYTTVDIPGPDRRFLREAFSTIYRDARPILESPDPVYMAAALFGGTADRSLLQGVLGERPQLEWYRAYCRAVLWPALYYYAEHGVVFEPHLQNTLVSFREGLPDRVWFRDLEGTKLVGRTLAGDPEAIASVTYSEEMGWRRFVYCSLFNQLAEVIDNLRGVPAAELWRETRRSLEEYAARHGARDIVGRMLTSPTLPAKANLLTRFRRSEDRQASYVEVKNPLRC